MTERKEIPVCPSMQGGIVVQRSSDLISNPVVVDKKAGTITIKVQPVGCNPRKQGNIYVPVMPIGSPGYCVDSDDAISWERREIEEGIIEPYPTIVIKNPGCCHWRGSIVRRKNMPRIPEAGQIYWEIQPLELDMEPSVSERIESQNIPVPGCELELSYEFTTGKNRWQDVVDSTYWCTCCFTGGWVRAIHGTHGDENITYTVEIMGQLRTCRPSDYIERDIDDWTYVAYLGAECAGKDRAGCKNGCAENENKIGIMIPLDVAGYNDGLSHDYIEFGLDIVPLFDTTMIDGTIIEIDRLNNQADVETTVYGRITAPFFYHCLHENTVEYGHQAFSEDDEVVLLCESARSKATPEIQIVSFADGLKPCEAPCVVFRCGKSPDFFEVVWDLRTNDFFYILDGANPVEFPVSTLKMEQLGFYNDIRYASGPTVEMYERFQNPHDLSTVPAGVFNARLWISGPDYIPVGDLLARRVVEYPATMYHEPFLPDNFTYNSRINYDGPHVDFKSWYNAGLARSGSSHQWGISTVDPGGLTGAWFESGGETAPANYWWVSGRNYDVFRAGAYSLFPIKHDMNRSDMLRINPEFANAGGLSGFHLERFSEHDIHYVDTGYQALDYLDYSRRFVVHSPFGELLETKFHAIRTGTLYAQYDMDTHNFFNVPAELTANTQEGFVIQSAYSAALKHEIGGFVHSDSSGQPIGWKPPEMFPDSLWYPDNGVMAKQRPFSGVDVGIHIAAEYNRNTASIDPLSMERKSALESAVRQLVEESVNRIGPENHGLTYSKPQIIKVFYSKT